MIIKDLTQLQLFRLIFIEVDPQDVHNVKIVGKYGPFESALKYVNAFFVKKHLKNYVIGGDDSGCLFFMELDTNWHICNSVLQLYFKF